MRLFTNSAARLMDKRESGNSIQRSTYAFMPAVLEVQETPPSPIGRAIIWSISLLFVVAIAWGVIGKMDVVAVAQGKIIPGGRVKTVQPLEIGKIKVIHVAEGQAVNAGEPLITLDSTATQADADQLQQQLRTAKLNAIRQQQFHALLDTKPISESWQDDIKEPFQRFEGDVPRETRAQYWLLIQQIQEYQSRELNLQSELSKRKAEQQRVLATLTKLERTLPLVTERMQSQELLMRKQMVARDQYLELEQQRIEQEQDLIALEAQSLELVAAIESIHAQFNVLNAEAQKNNLLEWSQTEQQIAALQQQLIKVRQRNQQQIIRSPINGTVQQLAIHTVGGVVTPAQALMQIVPKNSVLEVEAMILNKDIGFVEEGQSAEVKIDAFNFTRYGTVDASIEALSSDAISHDKLGLVYLAKVFIKQSQMLVNTRLVNLSPGMSVTVEVKTGKRRIIEYFLSPLLRYKQESIRER